MTADSLERALKDLPHLGTLVKSRPYRQVWRIALGGETYYLKFYPRAGARWKRAVRGNPAMREFVRLQWLQKAGVPAPRAVAVLVGFRLEGIVGDLVVLEGIEPSVPLDEYVQSFLRRGEQVAGHRVLAIQVNDLLEKLGRAKLGHADLHLGNFLLSEGRVYLLDAYAVRKGGLRTADLLRLAHSAAGVRTRTDLLRTWRRLGGGAEMPKVNRMAGALRRRWLQKIWGENRYFGTLNDGGWGGVFFRAAKVGRPWSAVSELTASDEDWRTAWATLWAQVEGDQLEVIKRSRSGDVLGGEMMLGGKAVPIAVKRPRRRYWYRYVNEIGRGGRARRAWRKAWSLVARDIPTAWPMLLMEKRVAGYVTDALIVFERVPGETLAGATFNAMDAEEREMLFRRVGATLRRLEGSGLYHWDAKASNWIVWREEGHGLVPVLVDVDGIHGNWGVGEGMRRLLISLREHPGYTEGDSLALCRGYAPFAKVREGGE